MAHGRPERRPPDRTRSTRLAGAVLVVGAALVGVLGVQSLGSSSSAAPPVDAPLGPIGSPVPTTAVEVPAAPDRAPRDAGADHADPDGADQADDDGTVPEGVTVFDDEHAAVTRLDPALLAALRRAGTDARGDWVELYVNSGWRSAGYQERLFADAVARYGSEAEAARWVAPPSRSAHVTGDAVDVGPAAAAAWLAEHGARYGLCRTYENEPWHFEVRPAAIERGCPRPYADAAHDPRMR